MDRSRFALFLTLSSLLVVVTACGAPTPPGNSGPDLLVSAFDVSPQEVEAGDAVDVSFTIANQGDAQARPSTTRIVLSDTLATPQGGAVLAEIATPELAAAGTWLHSRQVTIPDTISDLNQDGAMWLWVVVDADDSAGQSQAGRANDTRPHPLTVGTGLSPACADPDQAVDVPDPKLRFLLEAWLEMQQGTSAITCLTLSRLVEGTPPFEEGVGAASLEGLQYAVNLRKLRLPVGEYSDLSPLAGLTRLELLVLYSPQLEDIGPLAGLTNLWHVDLLGGRIHDLSPLKDLPHLQHVWLSDNQIREITALVANPAIGEGDTVDLGLNCLSAQAMADVQTLRDRGAYVEVGTQNGTRCG